MKIQIITGPTNSGKTHTASKALLEGESSLHVSPLRMTAAENYLKSKKLNLDAGLITGESGINKQGCHISMTPECFGAVREVSFENALIDEAQFFFDEERGGAFIKVLQDIIVRDTLYIIAEEGKLEAVLEVILEWLEKPYEMLEPITLERRSPLVVVLDEAYRPKAGDAIIHFSRKETEDLLDGEIGLHGGHTLKEKLDIINAFNEGNLTLRSTNCIGIGCNLNIKRVVFDNFYRYNGLYLDTLKGSEIRQLAGRAGRDRTPGYVVAECEWEQEVLEAALSHDDEKVEGLLCSRMSDRDFDNKLDFELYQLEEPVVEEPDEDLISLAHGLNECLINVGTAEYISKDGIEFRGLEAVNICLLDAEAPTEVYHRLWELREAAKKEEVQ